MEASALTYRSVCLRPYEEEHIRQTVKWLNDPYLKQSFGLTRVITEEEHKTWLKGQANLLLWAIYYQDKKYCGNVSLQVNLRHQSAYFQIYLGDESVRGQGIGTNSLRAVLQYAFLKLSLNRIWLHTFVNNHAAIHLYQSEGFKLEGIERKAIYCGDRFIDQMSWALLKDEWKTCSSNFKKHE